MSVEDAQTAFLAGVDAVDPTKLVKAAIQTGALDDWFEDRNYPRPIHVIALGKAAPRMVWGLLEASVPFAGIGVTTPGQRKPSLEKFWHVGGHPVPTETSFAAGQAVFDYVDRLSDANVLVLISGGASSCVDVADDPRTVIAYNEEALASGADILAINAQRAKLSNFKAGGLGARLLARGCKVRTWVLSDVPAGQPEQVGSGPCATGTIDHMELANAQTAGEGAAAMLQALGYQIEGGWLDGDIEEAVRDFTAGLPAGTARIAWGEATVEAGPDAPVGGRCHHAALAAARYLRQGQLFFAGATDGADGTTESAGAWSMCNDWDAEALANRTAFSVLAPANSLRLGPTGTNVGDLWITLSK